MDLNSFSPRRSKELGHPLIIIRFTELLLVSINRYSTLRKTVYPPYGFSAVRYGIVCLSAANTAATLTRSNPMKALSIKPAACGSVSHGTLRVEDLLSSFASELEWQIRRNGEYFSRPENFALRDKLNVLAGEAQDAWNEDGETLKDEEAAAEMVNDLQDALANNFAPMYGMFGAHEGDGSDFGYWIDIEQAKESVGFVSSPSQEFPPEDFRGEWLHINERGNCTLYVREADGSDREIWSVV